MTKNIHISSIEEEQKVEPEKLKTLVYEATASTLESAKSTSLPLFLRPIYRTEAGSECRIYVPLPQYYSSEIFDAIDKGQSNPQLLLLSEYLWECGIRRLTHFAPVSDKADLAATVFHELIRIQLPPILERFQIKTFIERDEVVEVWSITHNDLWDSVCNHVTQQLETWNQEFFCTALRPIPSIELKDSTELQLDDSCSIRYWSDHERSLFASLHGEEYLWSKFYSPASVPQMVNIQVKVKFQRGKETFGIAAETVARKFDTLRWALMATSGTQKFLAEGHCLLFDRSGKRISKLGGNAPLSYPILKFTAEQAAECRRKFEDLQTRTSKASSKASDDIYAALRLLGRSSFAPLERDAFLEAVYGLDRLLTQGGGDSRYRFCLHGAAVLSQMREEKSEVLFKQLGEIYKERSSGAHGELANHLGELVPKARGALVDVLLGILKLEAQEEVNLSQGKIAGNIQDYVIRKVGSCINRHDA